MSSERCYSFEGFQLDLASGRLSDDAGPIAIAPKAGLRLSVGPHTGERDRLEGAAQGLVADLAARVASLGQAGDVLVSRILDDLVAGSGLEFGDRGMHALAENQQPRRVFAVA